LRPCSRAGHGRHRRLRRRRGRYGRSGHRDDRRHGPGRSRRMARQPGGARHGARERVRHADGEGQRDRPQGRLRQRRHSAGGGRDRGPLERRAARRPRGGARGIPGGGAPAGARAGARADEDHLREPARHAALHARCGEGAHGRGARAAFRPGHHCAFRRHPRPQAGEPGLARDARLRDRDARRHLGHQARLHGARALPRAAAKGAGHRGTQRGLPRPELRRKGRERGFPHRSDHALGHRARGDPEPGAAAAAGHAPVGAALPVAAPGDRRPGDRRHPGRHRGLRLSRGAGPDRRARPRHARRTAARRGRGRLGSRGGRHDRDRGGRQAT